MIMAMADKVLADWQIMHTKEGMRFDKKQIFIDERGDGGFCSKLKIESYWGNQMLPPFDRYAVIPSLQKLGSMKSEDAWNYMDNLCYKYDCHNGDGCEAVHSRSRHRNKKKYKLPELNDAEVNGRKFHLSQYVGILIPEALGDVTIRVEICTGGKCKETKVPTSGSMSVKDVVKSEYYKNLRKEKNISEGYVLKKALVKRSDLPKLNGHTKWETPNSVKWSKTKVKDMDKITGSAGKIVPLKPVMIYELSNGFEEDTIEFVHLAKGVTRKEYGHHLDGWKHWIHPRKNVENYCDVFRGRLKGHKINWPLGDTGVCGKERA